MDLTSILQLGAQPIAEEISKISDSTEKAIAIGALTALSTFLNLVVADVASKDAAAIAETPAA